MSNTEVNPILGAFQGLLSSLVRTVVPIVVTLVVTVLIKTGLPVDDELTGTITTFVSAALGGLAGTLYYLAVRILEKVNPALSWLLGSSKSPVAYAPTKDVQDQEVVAVPIDDVKASADVKKAISKG